MDEAAKIPVVTQLVHEYQAAGGTAERLTRRRYAFIYYNERTAESYVTRHHTVDDALGCASGELYRGWTPDLLVDLHTSTVLATHEDFDLEPVITIKEDNR